MGSNRYKTFDVYSSTALKGIAILMMMFHHCFLSTGRFAGYDISFYPFKQEWVVGVSQFFKMCVPVFAIITGYGLYLNYEKTKLSANRWVLSREIKLLSGFWIIFILSNIICQLVDGKPYIIYFRYGVIKGIEYMILDFFGVSLLTDTPRLNGTWWYMSAAVVFVLLIPVIMKYRNSLPIIFGLVFVIPRLLEVKFGGRSIISFIPALLIGVIAAHYDIVNKWLKLWNTGGKKYIKLIAEFGLMCFFIWIYPYLKNKQFLEIKWGVIPFILILFCLEFVVYIPVVRQVLYHLGRHSMNIFLIHTFIRQYYMKSFIYSFKHFLLVVAVLLMISLVMSYVLEGFKKLIRYDKAIDRIRMRVEQCGTK